MSAPPAFSRDVAFGRLVGVPVPAHDDAAAQDTLAARLLPAERAHAGGLRGLRRATWLGGRVALRTALEALGVAAPPLVVGPRGEPELPAGVAGSISHKDTFAVALAARADTGETLGVDVEIDPTLRAPRVDIAPRVLTDAERTRLDALAPAARTRELLLSFAAKEAVYKALDPWVRRSVSFKEVELAREPDGTLSASFRARPGEGPFSLELDEESVPGLILIIVRIRFRG